MVVDAKAPLLAYLDALEATDENIRDANLKKHASQVRDHVTSLSAKTYWAQFQPSPEFVVMFLPAETFFNAALQQDPTLIEFAANRRVVLASPTSLIALLYAVAHGWQQQDVANGVLELGQLGRTLYDRLRVMVTHFDTLRVPRRSHRRLQQCHGITRNAGAGRGAALQRPERQRTGDPAH
jgi:DNA recombination protein RmuC